MLGKSNIFRGTVYGNNHSTIRLIPDRSCPHIWWALSIMLSSTPPTLSRWCSYYYPSKSRILSSVCPFEPTLVPQFLCPHHPHISVFFWHIFDSANEFWQFKDPSSPAHVKQCLDAEDMTCSNSIGEFLKLKVSLLLKVIFSPVSTGINIAHITYFGQGVCSHHPSSFIKWPLCFASHIVGSYCLSVTTWSWVKYALWLSGFCTRTYAWRASFDTEVFVQK